MQQAPVVQQPASATPSQATATSAKTKTRAQHRAASSKVNKTHAKTPARRPQPAAAAPDTRRADQATTAQRHAALTATRRIATVLAFDAQAVSRQALSDGELIAAATLLLLFVAAAASVLRLSARMGDVPRGRLG